MLRWFPSACVVGLSVFPVQAQVVTDGSLGIAERSQITTQGTTNTITGGAVRDNGLFHSFEAFNVAEGRSLYFIQPDGISQIFSRVTGDSPSNILGTLGVQQNGVLGNADLYLLNPNGILLGPNAQLDLGGSFFASTADSLKFGAEEFRALAPTPAPLLNVNVNAGIQYGANAPSRLIQNQADLTLMPQQQLVLDGGTVEQAGPIDIPAGTVSLRGENLSVTGQINTRSAEGQVGILNLSSPTDLTIGPTALLTNASINQALQENEVVVESDRNLTLIGALTNTNLTPLTLSAGNDLKLLANDSGVTRLAGNTTLQSGNELLVENQVFVGLGQPNPRFKLEAGGDVLLRDSPLIENNLPGDGHVAILALSGENGTLSIQGKNLTMQANGFTIREGNPVLTITAAPRAASLNQRGPDVEIVVSETINFQSGTGIVSVSGDDLNGNGQTAGDIRLNAKRVTLDGSTQQSQITTATNLFSKGNAGNISINATELLEVIGNQPGPFTPLVPSQIGLLESVVIIQSATPISAIPSGPGNSGNIEINTGQLKLRDGAAIGNVVGLFGGSEKAGNVVINADDIQLQGFALLATSTFGEQPSGQLEISSDRIRLEDGAAILTGSGFQQGKAGDILIQTNDLRVSGGSVIASSTSGTGQAGGLEIDAQSITVDGISVDGTFPSSLLTDAFDDPSNDVEGAGGDLQIQTETLQVLNGGQIRASTQGTGDAGDVKITAGQVLVSGTSINGIPSTLEAQSTGIGAAGVLDVKADNLTIRDRALATTESQLGDGGNILISLDDFLLLRQEGKISATAGSASALADGRNIQGDGGNITIEADFIIAPPDENSDITADAFGGSGGNVEITTQKVLGIEQQEQATEQSDITASSRLVVGEVEAGTVNINETLQIEPDEGLAELPQEPLNEDDEVSHDCDRYARSRFIATGRGGIPPNPRQQLLGQSLLHDWRTSPTDTSPADMESSQPNVRPAQPHGRYGPGNSNVIVPDSPSPVEAVGLRITADDQVHLFSENRNVWDDNLQQLLCSHLVPH